MKTSHLLVTIGTRPEAVKMAPLIRALRDRPWARVRVLATGQHREMLAQILEPMGIRPDYDLDLMREDQQPAALLARLVPAVTEVLETEAPDLVLVQGDTTTAMATGLACHYRQIPVGHVEAGLRTRDKFSPFPEEMNRRLLGCLADLHFAPTPLTAEHLRREGVDASTVFVTGNTVIDALQAIVADLGLEQEEPGQQQETRILVTMHRRESFGEPLERICTALLALADREDVRILYPVHPNPSVRERVHARLCDHPRIELREPMSHPEFVRAMAAARLILTDSGGVQEEAPSLGRPVLVLREETERSEAVEAGCSLVVGTDVERILEAAHRLLDDPAAWAAMARIENPYGDGKASQRICDILEQWWREKQA